MIYPNLSIKYNRSSIKGDENFIDSVHGSSIHDKYNRSSIKGDENHGLPPISFQFR